MQDPSTNTEPEDPELQAPPGTGAREAQPIAASTLVADDKDRPIADNKIRPGVAPGSPAPAPAGTPASAPKSKAHSTAEYQREYRAKKRAEAGKAGPRLQGAQAATAAPQSTTRPPPSFADLGRGAPVPGAVVVNKPPRNYMQEAASLFIPVSAAAGKFLGPHWGIEVEAGPPPKIKFTPEQEAYLVTVAQWIEYNQFPPMNPNLAMTLGSIAYVVPKLTVDPTPARIRGAWERLVDLYCKLTGRERKKKREEKQAERPDRNPE